MTWIDPLAGQAEIELKFQKRLKSPGKRKVNSKARKT